MASDAGRYGILVSTAAASQPWLYVGSLLLLVAVLFMPQINGSRRWIPLGLLDFQPSEPARLAFILALAHYLMYRDSQRLCADCCRRS